jgi:hypothetical protein
VTPHLRNKILDCLRDETVGNVSPSIRRIAKVIGASATPTYGALEQMRDDGLINWSPGRACSFYIVREGPTREQMARWSSDELKRVRDDAYAILDARLDETPGQGLRRVSA